MSKRNLIGHTDSETGETQWVEEEGSYSPPMKVKIGKVSNYKCPRNTLLLSRTLDPYHVTVFLLYPW